MMELHIDGHLVRVQAGATLLDAARAAGIEVPTLCHAPGIRPQTSCMVCVVEDTDSGKLLPACSAPASAGMHIETGNETVRAARRDVLRLLVSEHAGDCEAPCRRRCPGDMNIPLMLRAIARGDEAAAAEIAESALVMPAILGWLCTAPCELACRRGIHDATVAIQTMHRQMAEASLGEEAPLLPCLPDTGRRAAVVGAGMRGLAAAWVLRRLGHGVTLFDAGDAPGGNFHDAPESRLPRTVLDAELKRVLAMGIAFEGNRAIQNARALLGEYQAVVVACPGLDAKGEGVFAAPGKQLIIRAAASGKDAARAADAYLRGKKKAADAFDSQLGRFGAARLAAWVPGRIGAEALAREQQPEAPQAEAERCLHCDCHAPVSCKLRRYASEYGAGTHMFRASERGPEPALQQHGGVLFDAGKCIKCGLCVEITQDAGEDLGLTFVGRGYGAMVEVPFGGSLGRAIGKCADACIAACPTGALAWVRQEERDQ